MTRIRTAAIALLVHVVLLGASGFADPIEIGPNQFASTGIFRDLLNGTTTPVTGANISGLNTEEVRLDFNDVVNRLRFDGLLNDAPVDVGEPFLLGYLTYTNGIINIDLVTSEIFMQTIGGSALPARYNQTYTDRVFLNITPNVADPEQSADIVSLQNRPELGSLRVYEGRDATIELMGVFGSLSVMAFGNVVSAPGSGFFFPTLGLVPLDFIPPSTGNGTFIVPPVTAPEPATLTLFGAALALTLRRVIRRRKSH